MTSFLFFHSIIRLRRQQDIFNVYLQSGSKVQTNIYQPRGLDGQPESSDVTNGGSGSGAGASIEPPRDCSIPRPEPKSIDPTIVASYPGSGAKLTWKLIRAVTGIMTGDDFDHNGLVSKGNVVSIKTHYPTSCCSNEDTFKPFLEVDQSILLLRNPLNALPSYHNFAYERMNNLENHSSRAPFQVWIKWRDDNFDEHLTMWINHVKFWMSHHPYEKRKIITYEHLIDASTGPETLSKIREFIMRGQDDLSSPNAPPEDDIGCVWDYVVNIRADENTRKSSLRKGAPVPYPYTAKQMYRVQDELEALQDLYPGQLGPFMEEYLKSVMLRIRSDHRINYLLMGTNTS